MRDVFLLTVILEITTRTSGGWGAAGYASELHASAGCRVCLSLPNRLNTGPPVAILLRLRGAGVLSGFDQQLQDEILNDIKRDEQGKLPLFIEQLGEEGQTGDFKYGAGVEAALPPVIGDTAMDDNGGEEVPAAAVTENLQTRQQREAEELAEAQRYFAEIDEKYFPPGSTFADPDESEHEPILGHAGIPQRREFHNGEILESYLELRRDAPELSRFMQTLPHNNSLIAQALDDYGWHEGILRNGTRIKWTPDIRVHNESSLSEEESAVFDEKDGFWFRETIFEVARAAWSLPADTDFAHHFRQHNHTFTELANMRAFLNDTFIISVDDELALEAADDPHRLRAREELWELFSAKWGDFVEGKRFPDEVHAAYTEIENEAEARWGGYMKYLRPYTVDRRIDYGDPDSDEVATPWGVEEDAPRPD